MSQKIKDASQNSCLDKIKLLENIGKKGKLNKEIIITQHEINLLLEYSLTVNPRYVGYIIKGFALAQYKSYSLLNESLYKFLQKYTNSKLQNLEKTNSTNNKKIINNKETEKKSKVNKSNSKVFPIEKGIFYSDFDDFNLYSKLELSLMNNNNTFINFDFYSSNSNLLNNNSFQNNLIDINKKNQQNIFSNIKQNINFNIKDEISSLGNFEKESKMNPFFNNNINSKVNNNIPQIEEGIFNKKGDKTSLIYEENNNTNIHQREKSFIECINNEVSNQDIVNNNNFFEEIDNDFTMNDNNNNINSKRSDMKVGDKVSSQDNIDKSSIISDAKNVNEQNKIPFSSDNWNDFVSKNLNLQVKLDNKNKKFLEKKILSKKNFKYDFEIILDAFNENEDINNKDFNILNNNKKGNASSFLDKKFDNFNIVNKFNFIDLYYKNTNNLLDEAEVNDFANSLDDIKFNNLFVNNDLKFIDFNKSFFIFNNFKDANILSNHNDEENLKNISNPLNINFNNKVSDNIGVVNENIFSSTNTFLNNNINANSISNSLGNIREKFINLSMKNIFNNSKTIIEKKINDNIVIEGDNEEIIDNYSMKLDGGNIHISSDLLEIKKSDSKRGIEEIKEENNEDDFGANDDNFDEINSNDNNEDKNLKLNKNIKDENDKEIDTLCNLIQNKLKNDINYKNMINLYNLTNDIYEECNNLSLKNESKKSKISQTFYCLLLVAQNNNINITSENFLQF